MLFRSEQFEEEPLDVRLLGSASSTVKHLNITPRQFEDVIVVIQCLEGLDKAREKRKPLTVEIIAKYTREARAFHLANKRAREKAEELSTLKATNTELATMQRIQSRCKKMKEEIAAAACHPRRIERILELGGFEAVDNFMGS